MSAKSGAESVLGSPGAAARQGLKQLIWLQVRSPACLGLAGGSCAECPHQTSSLLETALAKKGRPIPVSSVTGFTLVRSSNRCNGVSWPRNSCRSSLPWASGPEPWPFTWEGITGPGELEPRPGGSAGGVEACTVARKLASSITVWLGSNFSFATS